MATSSSTTSGLSFFARATALFPILGLPGNLQVRFGADQHSQTSPNHRVVICNEDFDLAHIESAGNWWNIGGARSFASHGLQKSRKSYPQPVNNFLESPRFRSFPFAWGCHPIQDAGAGLLV